MASFPQEAQNLFEQLIADFRDSRNGREPLTVNPA
jgi:hypothetical protein